MKLSERALMYFVEQKKNCAVSMLMAANDHYSLGLQPGDADLIAGFGGGIGCGKICGMMAASVAVLGKLYAGREDFKKLCQQLVRTFRQEMGCDSIDCKDLAPVYKVETGRCVGGVEKWAEAFEKFLSEIE